MSGAARAATLVRMSLDPTLLVRRWPERRPVVLAVAAVGFAAVAAAVQATGNADLGTLYVLPVMLAALELGLIGGLAVAAGAGVLTVVSGDVAPAVVALVVGGVAGRFSTRMRELLREQAELAAENRQLLEQEREALALEAELLEQRTGLGRLLDAHEDDRRRHAQTLHEELAQVLAGVLMTLRALRRQGADSTLLDELHGQLVGVMAELRDLATELRPSTLAEFGVVPALEALGDVAIEADELERPLPEPLQIGVYRLVQHVLASAEPGARVRLSTEAGQLDIVLDAAPRGTEPVTAARARVALLGGALTTEGLPDGRIRLSARLPLQPVRAETAGPAGSVARTTVRPTVDSISS